MSLLNNNIPQCKCSPLILGDVAAWHQRDEIPSMGSHVTSCHITALAMRDFASSVDSGSDACWWFSSSAASVSRISKKKKTRKNSNVHQTETNSSRSKKGWRTETVALRRKQSCDLSQYQTCFQPYLQHPCFVFVFFSRQNIYDSLVCAGSLSPKVSCEPSRFSVFPLIKDWFHGRLLWDTALRSRSLVPGETTLGGSISHRFNRSGMTHFERDLHHGSVRENGHRKNSARRELRVEWYQPSLLSFVAQIKWK